MHKLIEYVCGELEDLEHKAAKDGKLSMQELSYADTLAHLKKNLLKAEEMSGDSEYSMGRNYSMRDSYRGGSYRGTSYRDSYADEAYVRPDGSYARGRGAGAKRDSMGRYSSEGNEAAYDVRMLLNRTHDEQTRQELSKLLDKLESM